MKRKLIAWTSVAALGVAAYLGSHLHAQGPQLNGGVQQASVSYPAQAPRSRIAVINIAATIRNYQKWQEYERTMRSTVQGFDKEMEAKRTQVLQLQTQLKQLPADSPDHDAVENRFKAAQRDLQDWAEQKKKELGQYSDRMAVQVYQEIHEAVAAYARAHDIDMVMHFTDAVAPADLYTAANIMRKLGTAACMPMYVSQGMDITGPITEMLNQRLGGNPAAAPAH